MIAFLVELENKPGSVADLTEAIAERGINIVGAAGIGSGSAGHIALATNDEAGTRQCLKRDGYTFSETEIVPLTIADTPGSFARACRALANAGVNIEAAFPMVSGSERNTVAFATSDPAKARSILDREASRISAR